MASSFENLKIAMDQFRGLIEKSNSGCSTYVEGVRIKALEVRRIIDELFEPPDVTWKKERALMFALERIAGGLNMRLSVEEEHNRTARIFEAAKRIHRATDQEELNQGLDDLNVA